MMYHKNYLYIYMIVLFVLLIGCDSQDDYAQDVNKQKVILESRPTDIVNNTESIKTDSVSVQKEVELPKDITNYITHYQEHTQQWQSFWQKNDLKNAQIIAAKKEEEFLQAREIDKELLTLRKKYINTHYIDSLRKEYGCLLPDCSAKKLTQQQSKTNSQGAEEVYIYQNMDILQAYQNIVLDKNTQIFSDLEIVQEYDYVLKNKQTTTIDLQTLSNLYNNQAAHSQYKHYKTLQFKWHDSDELIVALTPKEEICQPNQYVIITTFKQQENDVIATKYEKKLAGFSYPLDLVSFIDKSCSCIAAMDSLTRNITTSHNKDFNQYTNNAIQAIKKEKNCQDIESQRKELWEKYMQDSRIIGILQQEQRMYKIEFAPLMLDNADIQSKK